MEHRHIYSSAELSSVAIDDIIDRGGRKDWARLRDCADKSSDVLARIRKICAAYVNDAADQKYALWRFYAG